jgi:hypothetical protein
MSRRYILADDNDGHWHVVPVDRFDEFIDFLNDEDAQDLGNLPEGVWAVGGSTTQVTFENPTVDN